MLAYTPGTAIQALQRLAASNPMLYKALLHMKKDSDGCISAATLVQVSCNAVRKLMHASKLQQISVSAHSHSTKACKFWKCSRYSFKTLRVI